MMSLLASIMALLVMEEEGRAEPVEQFRPVQYFGTAANPPAYLSSPEEDEMLSATVTLTNDQIKALPTTAIEVIAAPGANKVIFPIAAWLHLLNWAGDYDNVGSTSRIGLEYNGTLSSTLSPIYESANGEVTNLLIDGASHPAFMGLRSKVDPNTPITNLVPSGIGQFIDDPGTINTSIRICAVNSGSATGNFTVGHANNTLKVIVYYVVVDLA